LPQGKLPGSTIEQKKFNPHEKASGKGAVFCILFYGSIKEYGGVRGRDRAVFMPSAFRGDTSLDFG